MHRYRATSDVPPLVARAQAIARDMGFAQSCMDEVGRLLMLLAGRVRGGTVAEIGAGCGVGAAWIASGLAPSVPFVTIEVDATRAEAARALLSRYDNARVLTGDWREILAFAPFTLLFADGGRVKEPPLANMVRAALAPDGLIVLDDLSPEERWPPEWRGRRDPVRDYWLNHPDIVATEIRTTATTAAIIAGPVPCVVPLRGSREGSRQ